MEEKIALKQRRGIYLLIFGARVNHGGYNYQLDQKDNNKTQTKHTSRRLCNQSQAASRLGADWLFTVPGSSLWPFSQPRWPAGWVIPGSRQNQGIG